MQKLYSLCKKRLQPLFCATAGILYMTMFTAQPVFAEDVATGGENIWSRFSTIMQDVYGELVAISTIVAVTVASIQSLGQLQNRYPNNLWAEILGNTDVQLMLGCTDDISAEYFSARSGDMSIQINTTMTVRQTLAVAQMIPQYRHTEGQGKRRLLTPDEVLRLPNEELLVIIRGHNVLKLNKLDYTRLPMAAQIEKRSILDYTPQPSITRATPEPVPEPKPERKKMRPSLYSSASPPEDF